MPTKRQIELALEASKRAHEKRESAEKAVDVADAALVKLCNEHTAESLAPGGELLIGNTLVKRPYSMLPLELRELATIEDASPFEPEVDVVARPKQSIDDALPCDAVAESEPEMVG
ncbi:MAG: hypothetical protein AAF958_13340 [Planctomycetota bacterium]